MIAFFVVSVIFFCAIHAVHSGRFTTAALYLVGALVLAGVPPFSGFFSKDEILAAAFERRLILHLALAAAGFPPMFDITRQRHLILTGDARGGSARTAPEPKRLIPSLPAWCLPRWSSVCSSLRSPG